jgi:predicted RNA-binding Zn-ribbon protein involved in translation (DUF1610 family)
MAKHIHQYKRADLGVNKEYIVYRCTLPDCGHYLVPKLVEGKESLCPRCGEVFIIEKSHLSLANPHCDNCTVKKEVVNA